MPISSKKEKIRKSLKYSILDASFYSVMTGFGESFIGAFAAFMKATSFQLGLIGSLPQAIGSFFQLYTNKLVNLFGSRKRFLLTGVLLQGLMYIPMAITFLLPKFNVGYLLIFASIYWLFGMIVGPAWNSWMGDLVDEKIRGTYFGKRNMISNIVSFVSMLGAGLILKLYPSKFTYYAFLTIFSIAFIGRILSFYFLSRQYESKHRPYLEEHKFIDFIKQSRKNNFGLLVFFLVCMNFGVYFAAPYFTAYMLYDLKLDYLTFTIINATSVIVKFLMMPAWGKAADKYGTRRALALASIMMPAIPILWLFSKDVWWLLLIQAYNGLVWAGFELCSFNFIFDTTEPKKRTLYVSYYNVLNGFAILIGAISGSVVVSLVHFRNHFFWSVFLIIFLISGIMRLIATIYFIPRLREVRHVKHISYRNLVLHIITAAPTMGLVSQVFAHNVVRIKSRISILRKRRKRYKKGLG